MPPTLETNDHSRDSAKLKYIYPVISRRAGGLSVGVNLNTNNACNWRCVYCQVPDLKLGAAPELDMAVLIDELRFFLNDVLHGDFYDRFQLPEAQRTIKDIAISGNGEPTSLKNFTEVITLIGEIATELGVFPRSHYVLITNGSLIHLPKVQQGLQQLNHYQGEVWFKMDSATDVGRVMVNNSQQRIQAALKNLTISTTLCKTKLQTCVFYYKGTSLCQGTERKAYLALLDTLKQQGSQLVEIMLYTLARPSYQPEAPLLQPATLAELHDLANDIKNLGFNVSMHK